MKQITIIGNLGANAVRRVASDGKEIMTFNVAVNQANAEPVWFNCIGNLREKLLPFLVKGQCVCVIGDLAANVYNNRIDLSINIDRTELCGAKPEEKNENQ
jgi:single-stranded DNA-binding protein